MSYRIGETIVTLTCNTCGTSMFEDKGERTNLVTTQSLWRRAEQKGWTSSSTQHFCKKHSS